MKTSTLAIASALLTCGVVSAQTEIKVSSDITTSTTWTNNNTYNLQKQIYVRPGASLTIQAGTVIASDTGKGGSLAVAAGAQIFVQGEPGRPVIFTSKADVATWKTVNGRKDPRTGTWRESANEWGNLTIMGRAYISEDIPGGNRRNTPTPNANNRGTMEGLVPASANDTVVLYGGGNDDDDSGSISYMSTRYGGRVIALNNELNGISLGGIGRGTDLAFIEVMNNVDDGIEIWGGTVNLRNFAIWYVGDDSLDIDQGWRGKAQFGLIVQGYSLNARQGSGLGDNCFELDGAENSDWQPVTTASIYNCTVIGEPNSGDHGTAWRDGARVQFHNCIFMDLGEDLVKFDNIDGDGGKGYGHNGTLSWPAVWNTNYNVYSRVNAPSNPQAFYKSQISGKLSSITNSVFYNNRDSSAYTEANSRGVLRATQNNTRTTSMPIRAITRDNGKLIGGSKLSKRVTSLNPLPSSSIPASKEFASTNDNFFEAANFIGAFAPDGDWLNGWTASSAYGLTPKSSWMPIRGSLSSPKRGAPVLSATGTLAANQSITITGSNLAPGSGTVLIFGSSVASIPLFRGTLLTVPAFTLAPLLANGQGRWSFSVPIPSTYTGGRLVMQAWTIGNDGPAGWTASNGLIGN